MRHYVISYFTMVFSKEQKVTMNPVEVEEVAWVNKQTVNNFAIAPKAKEVLLEFLGETNGNAAQ